MSAPTTYTSTAPGALSTLGTWAGSPNVYPGQPQTITNVVTTSTTTVVTLSTTAVPAWQVGDTVDIAGVVGATEANGHFTLTAVSGATITFTTAGSVSAYVSGGTAIRGDFIVVWHAVTLSSSVSIGNSASSNTNVISITGSPSRAGTLTVNSGVTLTVRGSISSTFGAVTFNSGSTLYFDGSLAATPSSAAYRLSLSSAGSDFTCNGTNGSHVTVTQNTANSAARVICNIANVNATYTDFSNLSTFNATIPAAGTYSLTNCTFTNCSGISSQAALVADGTYVFTNNKFISSPSGAINVAFANISPAANTTGTRTMNGCVFDKICNLYAPKDFSFGNTTGNFFGAGFVSNGSVIAKWATFTNNFAYNLAGVTNYIQGDFTNNYVTEDPTITNPHAVVFDRGGYDILIDGNIVEYFGSDATGDCFLMGNATGAALPGGSSHATLTHNLILPNGGNTGDTGTLMTLWGASNMTITCDHNTYFTKGQQGIAFAEGYNGYAGMVLSCRSNLAYGMSGEAGTGRIVGSNYNGATGVSDYASSTIVNFNAGYNLSTHYSGLTFSSGSAGANDITANPNFVDSTRNIATWYYGPGGGTNLGTYALNSAAAVALIQATPSLTASSLMPWVKAGYAPTNAAYQNAGHDSIDIGAIAGYYTGWYASNPIIATRPIVRNQASNGF